MTRIRSIAAVAAVASCIVFLNYLREATVYGANPAPSQALPTTSHKVGGMATAQAQSSPTWSRDVASVLYKNCTTCHHPGGAGPFSLLTYADARRWGPQLMTVTRSRFMPPWLPEPGFGDFADVRRLSDHERELIKQWVDAKMPQGDPAVAPAPPHYDANWLMGKPDLILKVARPFTLPGGGTDAFRNFILPYPLKETHYIRAMEIRPGTPQIVHHANITIDRTGALRRQFPNDWQNGVAGMELMVDSGNKFDPDSHFLFWKPDTPALVEPAGMPWRLDPGNDLILNMHLKPSGKAETLDAEVGLYFTPDPPAKQPMLIDLERDDALDIPAGAANFVVEDSLTLPVDVDVFGVYPHAHYLGRDMQGWAILPNGEKKWLVWIRNWDIDRQAVYRYKEPVLLPKGTVLHMRYTYDNSSTNIHNPHSPPVRVRAGNRSEDEMAHLWFQVLPINVQPGAPDPRLLLEDAWMRERLRKTPGDQVSLYNYAAALTGEGKFAEAVSEFGKELNRSPHDVRTLTALGAALEGAGDWQQAQLRFRSAIEVAGTDGSAACDPRFDLASSELRHNQPEAAEEFRTEVAACPDDAEALTGLAQIEIEANQTSQAIQHLTTAIRINPSLADAHEQLARAYAQGGDLQGALAELEKAAQLKPDDATIHSGLSQVLAATGDLQRAIDEQRAALKLLKDDADGWNNLGVLEARTGHASAARDAFQHALRLDPQHLQAKANLERLQTQK
jgi:Flp pilus assembly protein TadD/mono/diheme cytochrome c family protein